MTIRKFLALCGVIALCGAAIAGCAAFIHYDNQRVEHRLYAGCWGDTDVYVTLELGTLTAAQSSVCLEQSAGNAALQGELPDEISFDCVEVDGLGLGVARLQWRGSFVLVESASCQPL